MYDYIKALHYAEKGLLTNGQNSAALQLIATIQRINKERDQADNALQKLIDEADLVTEMREIKHPFHAGIYAQQGIEF